jgi:hypothetical protein
VGGGPLLPVQVTHLPLAVVQQTKMMCLLASQLCQHCQLALLVPPVTPTHPLASLCLIPSPVNHHLLAAMSPSHGGGRAWRQGSRRRQCPLTRLRHLRQL